MLKQSSSRMKKVLAILLAVLFVVSLTAVAVSAANEMKDPPAYTQQLVGAALMAWEIVLVITYGMHAELRMDAHTALTTLSTLIMRPIFNFIL